MDFKIAKDGAEVYVKNIADIAREIHARGNDEHSLDASEMTIWDKGKNIQVAYVFENISGRESDTGDTIVEWARFYVFLKVSSGH